MSVKRFIFHMCMAVIFCCTAIIGPVIIDAIMIGLLVIAEIIAIILLFVPFAGTFLFRITGIEGLADGEYIDVYLADGWLHKFMAFFMVNVICSGVASLYFSILESIRVILGLSLLLFIITVSLKVDNAKNDYGEKKTMFTDFIPTILGLGIACYVIFAFTAAPTVIGIILLCLTAGVSVTRDILALARW